MKQHTRENTGQSAGSIRRCLLRQLGKHWTSITTCQIRGNFFKVLVLTRSLPLKVLVLSRSRHTLVSVEAWFWLVWSWLQHWNIAFHKICNCVLLKALWNGRESRFDSAYWHVYGENGPLGRNLSRILHHSSQWGWMCITPDLCPH